MRRFLVAGAAALASVVAIPAQAEVIDNRWYIGALATYLKADEERLTDDGVGAELVFGRAISRHFNFELRGFGGTLDAIGAGEDTEQYGIGTDLLYMFSRGNVKPFLLAGFGAMRDFVPNNGIKEDDNNFYVNAGLGLMWELTGHGTALRAETRYRRVNNDDSIPNEDEFEDWEVSLGVQVPLGSASHDSDGDGVHDKNDRCPGTPAGRSVNSYGCEPDSDGDGVIDANDRCPSTRPGVAVGPSGCPSDADGDGVADGSDACPNTPAGELVGPNGCAIDSDRDGVINDIDKCPNTAPGVDVDYKGCEIKDVISLDGVNFPTNSSVLTGSAKAILDQAAGTLNRFSTMVVEVAGHTDSTGDDRYNKTLSQRRANSVRKYLIQRGIDSSRVSARGYGESMPIATNTTHAGRAKNRRVEFRIISR